MTTARLPRSDPAPRSSVLSIPDPSFPTTRYLGSKRRWAGEIVRLVGDLNFQSVLDAFGGTGAVAHAFKRLGRSVTFNDVLQFSHQAGVALIENDDQRLPEPEIERIGERRAGRCYGEVIERNFSGVYFLDDENRWLDTAIGNVRRIRNRYHRAVAWSALFQSALQKRPYNLFHRKNLYLRMADVPRSFGNKTTWERGFFELFQMHARSINASIVDGAGRCRALRADAMALPPDFDLVYVDPPYVSASGVGVDYHHYYHFLEGMMQYDQWSARVDRDSRHLRLIRRDDPWSDPTRIPGTMRRLFHRFRDSLLVISYRSDGIPSVDEISGMLRSLGKRVEIHALRTGPYALSRKRSSSELLFVGR